MELRTPSSPHNHTHGTVTTVMLRVLYALLPGIAAYVYFFGWGVVITISFAIGVALISEAAMLLIRGRPLWPFLSDGSAIVTAVLLALSLPPLSPWWITLLGVSFSIVIAKHLYGGLGYNPFNPAMVGYAMLLISFPREMTMWFPPQMLTENPLTVLEIISVIFVGTSPNGMELDALTMATPLDTLKTQLNLEKNVADIVAGNPLFGTLGGLGWEWVNAGFFAGGIWLIYKRVISWHIPVALMASMFVAASVFYLISPDTYASPFFHLFSGATMLGAFFIATDPVTAATTPMGRLLYGAGIGLLTYTIRTWGGYPDAIAFSVLLMNMVVPTIDYYTQPRVFGHRRN